MRNTGFITPQKKKESYFDLKDYDKKSINEQIIKLAKSDLAG